MEGQPGSEPTTAPDRNTENDSEVKIAEPAMLSTPPLASSSRRESRLSWPPPRLPPRASTLPGSELPVPAATESSPPPGPDAPMFDANFSISASRTPSGEFRISQIRDLLFGDVQHQYEQRLASLESQVDLLQTEARTRLGVMESSIVGEIGGALSTLTNRVLSNESAEREERKRLDERVSALEDIFNHRLDAVEQELRSLRGDLDAVTEGMRMEMRTAAQKVVQDVRREIEETVQTRVHEEIGRIFLAIGGSLKKRVERGATSGTGDVALTIPPPPPAPSDVPTQDHPTEAPTAVPVPAAAPSSAPEVVASPPPAGHELTELERWAEELSSGDIPILDPDDDAHARHA